MKEQLKSFKIGFGLLNDDKRKKIPKEEIIIDCDNDVRFKKYEANKFMIKNLIILKSQLFSKSFNFKEKRPSFNIRVIISTSKN